MALMSTLSKVIRGMKEPIPLQSLPNQLRRQGVKEDEIQQSGILENAQAFADERGRATPEALQTADFIRPDVEGFSAVEQPRPEYGNISVPGTNRATYKERVYTDPRDSGTSDHFPGRYSFHTRSDVINRQEIAESAANTETIPLLPRDTAELSNSLKQYPAGSRQYEQLVGDLREHLVTRRGLDFDENALRNWAERDGTPEELQELLKPIDNEFEALGGIEPQFGDRALRIQEIQSDIANNLLSPEAVTEVNIQQLTDELVDSEIAASIRELRDPPDGLLTELGDFVAERFQLPMNDALSLVDSYTKAMRNNASGQLDWSPASKTNFEVPYVRQALYHELDRAQEEGIGEIQIAINPKGKGKLARSDRVQNTYETTVRSTAKKVAKQIGGEVKEKNGWLVIGLPAAGFSLPLYAQEGEPAIEEDPNASFVRTIQGRMEVSEEEARKMAFVTRARNQLGLSEEEAEAEYEARTQSAQQQPEEVVDENNPGQGSLMDHVVGAESMGHRQQGNRLGDLLGPDETSEEERRRFERERDAAYDTPVKDIVSALREGTRVQKPYIEGQAMFGNEEAQEYLAAMETEMSERVIPAMEERGVNLRYDQELGKYSVQDPDGNWQDVTPGLLDELYGTRFEIMSTMQGAAGGARALGTKWGWPGALIGGIGGGAIGAVVGTELDLLENWIQTQESLADDIVMEKAWGAAKASIMWDSALVGLGGVSKLGMKGVRGVRYALRQIANGNRKGAVDAVLFNTNKTRSEAEALVSEWEELNGRLAPGQNMDEKILSILPTTGQGGYRIVAGLPGNSRASVSIANEIDSRAKSLVESAGELTSGENTVDSARSVLSGLRTYVDDSKKLFNTVKGEFTENVDLSQIGQLEFDQDVSNVMDSILGSIQDPGTANFFGDRMQHILRQSRTIENGTDLMEFRHALTGLKFGGVTSNTRGLNAIDSMVSQVDGQIEKAAKATWGEEGGTEWLENWEVAKESYSEMLRTQKNGLFNALTKETTKGKAITDRSVIRALVRYGPSIDDSYIMKGGEFQNTYQQVFEKLDSASRKEVEGLITQELIEKSTIGAGGDFQAIDFEALSKEFQRFPLETPDATRIKTIVDRMAKLYRNDPHLSRATGQIDESHFQSYLTTNPITRAQFAIASEVFNWASTLKGGHGADVQAMLRHVDRLLQEPLNTKTTQHLLEVVKGDQALERAVRDFQAEYSKGLAEGTIKPPVKLRVYTDKAGNIYSKPGKGRRQRADTINGRHVARMDYVQQNYDVDNINSANDLTNLTKVNLINDGYSHILSNDGRYIKLVDNEPTQ